MSSSLEQVQKSAEHCMKNEAFTEAFFHWTKAIHLAEQMDQGAVSSHMFAQRSKCFMQSDQFYYAMEDARKVIDLEPSHPMGHLRLAEVYYETGHYVEALPEINRCFQLAPSKLEKDHLLEWQKKCRKNAAKQRMKDQQLPFVGAAIGIVIASLGVVADALAYGSASVIAHPVLKALVVILLACACYIIALLVKRNAINNRKALLQSPPDLLPKSSPNGFRAKSD